MSLITVAPGPRNAHTDSATGLRFYRWHGRDLPSVTTIRRLAGLPFGLHQWAISQVVKRAVDQYDELGAMLTRPRRPRERVLEKNRAKEAGQWLRKAATEERDRSAELGTKVHDAATSGKGLMDVEAEVRPRLRQFYAWLEDSGATILATEKQVWNLRLGYAGTFDLLVRLPNGYVYVVDIKTGKGTYVEHALQLIAYAMAEFIGEDNVIDHELTELLHGAQGMALLHLSDSGWEWQDVRVTPVMFDAFKGLLAFASFAHDHASIEGLLAEQIEGVAVL
jgi:hypothetical protein